MAFEAQDPSHIVLSTAPADIHPSMLTVTFFFLCTHVSFFGMQTGQHWPGSITSCPTQSVTLHLSASSIHSVPCGPHSQVMQSEGCHTSFCPYWVPLYSQKVGVEGMVILVLVGVEVVVWLRVDGGLVVDVTLLLVVFANGVVTVGVVVDVGVCVVSIAVNVLVDAFVVGTSDAVVVGNGVVGTVVIFEEVVVSFLVVDSSPVVIDGVVVAVVVGLGIVGVVRFDVPVVVDGAIGLGTIVVGEGDVFSGKHSPQHFVGSITWKYPSGHVLVPQDV